MRGLRRRRGSSRGDPCFRCGTRQTILCVALSSLSLVWFEFRALVVHNANDDSSHVALSVRNSNNDATIPWTCSFREYPERRYYRLDEKLPFLQDADYIRGLTPTILEGSTDDLKPNEGKLCVDQSQEVDPATSKTRPYSDGTNPSLLSLSRVSPELRSSFPAQATMLASICMTSGQCSWKDTPEEVSQYHLSPLEKPNSIYTKLLLLDSKLNTLQETILVLEKDAPWGRRSRQAQRNKDGTFVREPQAFDDSRLFWHSGQVWISYREGRGFGWDKQVISPIHFVVSGEKFKAHVKASETTAFCCGRNMALVSDGKPNTSLQSLTWVDPVTMIQVDDSLNKDEATKQNNRRLKAKKKESHFHGTNGFLLDLDSSNEYLGIGHFHRPPDRDTSDYARHGHHYTHAFYTVTKSVPHKLARLSREFVFDSKSQRFLGVADIIQFASGAELVGSDIDGKLLIAYGINDCEAASIYIDMKVVQQMLVKVEDGQEVVDLMQRLS